MSNTAQDWLNTKYKEKNSSGKIELYNRATGDSEELTGELTIENYVNIEEISFTRWGKKGKIKKVIITNCPQVKKIKFDDNEITEVIFKDNLPNLEWLDLPDNELKEIDVSQTPNLKRLHLARNHDLTKIKGLENLTKLETVNLLETPGLNGKEFKEWKERPTKEELDKVKGERDKRPDIKKEDWENDYSKRPTQGDLNKVKDELDKWNKKFPGKSPEQVEKDINDLQSKPTTSGTGAAFTPEQKAELEKMKKLSKWLLEYLKENLSSDQFIEEIEQPVNQEQKINVKEILK